MSGYSIKQATLDSLKAYGPVGIRFLFANIKDQQTEVLAPALNTYHIAEVLNELIRKGLAELYDDGESFDSTRLAHLADSYPDKEGNPIRVGSKVIHAGFDGYIVEEFESEGVAIIRHKPSGDKGFPAMCKVLTLDTCPKSVSPYDEGYSDGLAGKEFPENPPHAGIRNSRYCEGFIYGQNARNRHTVPDSSSVPSPVESTGNTEESTPSPYYYAFQTTPRIAFYIYRRYDGLPLAECAVQSNAELICLGLNSVG